jgi:hypothetical protein
MKTIRLLLLITIAICAFGFNAHAQTTNRFAATIFSVRTNDLSITNQTNATTTGLTFATQANARYAVTLYPILEASATSTVLVVVASNVTVFGTWNGTATGFANTNQITNEISLTITTPRAVLQGFYVVAGTNAGSVSLQFRSSVTNNTNTIKAGSFMRADKVPQ